MTIQWYPGHMAKAKRMLQENLQLIDVVVELLDARAPAATRNPDFDELFRGKARVVLLNKSDLADPNRVAAWITHFKSQGAACDAIVSTGGAGKKSAIALIEQAAAPQVARMKKKGVLKTVRVMVAGIPNVGKSTFINRLAGASRAQVGDKPGVTRGKQWVRITPYLELLDTPGLLWPKLEDEAYARHLAYLGSIKDDIMDVEQLAAQLLRELLTLAPQAVTAKYTALTSETPDATLLSAVAKCRGFLLPGNELDVNRAARIVLDEFRGGKIARVTFELSDSVQKRRQQNVPETGEDRAEAGGVAGHREAEDGADT